MTGAHREDCEEVFYIVAMANYMINDLDTGYIKFD
jgi:hypothetical protein